jgi:Family of unknown function (DUF5678)
MNSYTTSEPTTPALDLNSLLVGIPPGAWVAISADHSQVIAFGAEMREVLDGAKKKGEENPLIFRAPETNGALLL